MKPYACVVLLLAQAFFVGALATTSYTSLEDLAIQHEGRLKPLDTFARVQLLSIYEKSKVRGEATLEWLVRLLIDPEKAYRKPLFRVRNREVLEALEIAPNKSHLYSFQEIRTGLQKTSTTLQQLYAKPQEMRSLVENQWVALYLKSLHYFELSRSFTCFIPDITVDDPTLAAALDLRPGRPANYWHFILKRAILKEKLNALSQKETPLETQDKALVALVDQLNHKLVDQPTRILRILPPQGASETWASPWEWMDGRDLTSQQIALLQALQQAVNALLGNDALALKAALMTFQQSVPDNALIGWEVFYNKADFFYKSFYGYLLAFLLLALSWMGWRQGGLRRCSLVCLGVGAVFHALGIGCRIVIMGRPPVSTLYESILFVSLIAVLLCLLLEGRRKDSIGILTAALIGAVLHLIGFRYATDGDTLEMLVAVLNSNFWLTTHVLTITMGYGSVLVAGVVAHGYLAFSILKPQEKRDELYKNMIGLSLVALFFTILGTILGGIWADQSWGRFWGWDPKENGALLIVLWLLMLTHGRIGYILSPLGFATGLVLANIVVALAWFGVNLLSVGLHSYGFTENIAFNLALFCSIELLFALLGYALVRIRSNVRRAVGR